MRPCVACRSSRLADLASWLALRVLLGHDCGSALVKGAEPLVSDDVPLYCRRQADVGAAHPIRRQCREHLRRAWSRAQPPSQGARPGRPYNPRPAAVTAAQAISGLRMSLCAPASQERLWLITWLASKR